MCRNCRRRRSEWRGHIRLALADVELEHPTGVPPQEGLPTVVLQGHVRQLGEDPLALCGLHVQGDAPLVAVEHREIEAVDSRDVPQLLARDITRRSLELHDVCAQPGENLRARRSGLDVCHVQDADAIECLSQDSPLSCASVLGLRRIRDGVEPHVDQ